MMDPQVRGFPAFPPGYRRGGAFARTWWGKAWIKALEDTSLDGKVLRRGRRYAGAGMVGAITVSPGRVSADVHDGDTDAPYRTVVFVEQLTDAEWSRFGDQVASKAGHIAALLDRDMPRELIETAAEADVPLLPGIGDLEPECDCPAWELPCLHAAALSYQVAWLLDSDPFLLLLMRGRGGNELLDEWQGRGPRQPVAEPATPAADAYAAPVAALPDLTLTSPSPSADPLASLPAASGVDPAAIRLLATSAASCAGAFLAGSPVSLSDWSDAVRLAVVCSDGAVLARLRENSGRPSDFDRAVQAWSHGGHAGLTVLDEQFDPPGAVLARAYAALDSWDENLSESVECRGNWLTWRGRGWQLRYGRDGRWYPYRLQGDVWWPAAGPEFDPGAALAHLS